MGGEWTRSLESGQMGSPGLLLLKVKQEGDRVITICTRNVSSQWSACSEEAVLGPSAAGAMPGPPWAGGGVWRCQISQGRWSGLLDEDPHKRLQLLPVGQRLQTAVVPEPVFI